MDGTLSKIGIIDLAERASHLPVNRMVYIYGREGISAGETYGLMVTDAFSQKVRDSIHKNRKAALAAWYRMCQ